jgi:hypothetical protein
MADTNSTRLIASEDFTAFSWCQELKIKYNYNIDILTKFIRNGLYLDDRLLLWLECKRSGIRLV